MIQYKAASNEMNLNAIERLKQQHLKLIPKQQTSPISCYYYKYAMHAVHTKQANLLHVLQHSDPAADVLA